jgi:tetratricopeptide (TPR) repeat protein
MVAPLREAWVLNRAGILINRVVVARASDKSANVGGAQAAKQAAETKNALAEATALLQAAAARSPQVAALDVPIWRTYGAAAALAPSNEAFDVLLRAQQNDMLDRIGELWLGEVASATNHPDEAAAAYRLVDASNLLISQADAFMESGDKNSAIREYGFARVSLEAVMQRDSAERLLRGGDDGSSVTAALMTSTAERVTALYRIGRGLLSAGEPGPAATVLEEAFEKAGTASPGSVAEQALDLNMALALAQTLPDPPESFTLYSTFYFPDQRAVDYLAKVARIQALVYKGVALGPTASVYVLAGRVLLLTGDDQQATSFLREAIHLDPLIPDSYLVLGAWYDSKGMTLLPLQVYSEGLRALPGNTQIAVAYAVASYKVLAPSEALPLLQKTAKMATNDPFLFATLGDCYLRLGMVEDGREAYEEGLRRSPGAKPLTSRLETLGASLKAHHD